MISRDWVRAIGFWQLIGGAITAVTVLDALRGVLSADGRAVTGAIALSACGLSVLASYALVKQNRAGLVPSILVWLLQLVAFSHGRIGFQLTLGPYAYLGEESNLDRCGCRISAPLPAIVPK